MINFHLTFIIKTQKMLRHCIRSFFYKQVPYTFLSPTLSPLLSLTKTTCKPCKPCNWVFSSNKQTTFSTSFSSCPYYSVQIHCPKDVSDSLSEALLCFGATSTATDEQENCENQDEVSVTSIFLDRQDVDECILRAAKSIGLEETPSYKVTEGDESNWTKLSQESFEPVEITQGLWTVPEWTTPPDLQAVNIILNPGFAFGTGDHPTTKLCLLLLRRLIKGGELVLDYGTGSGVLAIAGVKFGAASSVGLDIDPEAITSARHNATLNNIETEKLQLHLVDSKITPPMADEVACEHVKLQTVSGISDISETGKFDVVIANILLNPLLDLADHIVSYAKPGGVIGVSGILSEQVQRVVERYSPFLENISVTKMEDWACISGTKRKDVP